MYIDVLITRLTATNHFGVHWVIKNLGQWNLPFFVIEVLLLPVLTVHYLQALRVKKIEGLQENILSAFSKSHLFRCVKNQKRYKVLRLHLYKQVLDRLNYNLFRINILKYI